MPEITKAAPGTFCWIELGTTDVAAAKKFYGGLFGWTITDVPMGGMTYGLAALGAKQIASLGGKVLVGPLDIGQGHMAVAADPTGAVFAVWQSVQSMGTWLMGEPGSLGWNELLST